MVIHQNVIVENRQYNISADTGVGMPLLVIEGTGITVDFNHAVLQGTNDPTQPNQFAGLAIFIKKGSSNITVKNANVNGYKIALMADGVANLKIENCDFSYNYRQHLHSNFLREDISDWMSYHHNENDEWMRYGAGIYLKECNNANISNSIITNGQCGLMMVRCNNAIISDNNFSFNSGLGIGMYRSSNNTIVHNRLDFNVRGVQFGKYYRGQDSGGILVFEQCNNNVIAYNSVTHSGDGFFLWAGQHTMDTGEGGCNDNLLYGNDFSYAPTNGVEITFSRNIVANNIIIGCDHGVWGGYSYNTLIDNNSFADNRIAIAIEHGQHIGITDNNFSGDKTAIRLWSRATQPADWLYAQRRDTRSVDYKIAGNSFSNIPLVFDIMGTDSMQFVGNTKSNNNLVYKWGERVTNVDSTGELHSVHVSGKNYAAAESLKYNSRPATKFNRGRQQMRITEWGPYNFEYPLLWLDSIDNNGLYHFAVLGKTGKWKINSISGFKIVAGESSTMPSTIIASADSTVQNRFIELVYSGKAFTDMFGAMHVAGKPYSFRYNEFDVQAKWRTSFYKWDSVVNPVKDYDAFYQSLKDSFYSFSTNKIDYTWWSAVGKNMPADSFATVATTVIDLPENDYEVGLTADDLAKLFIDDKPVIDAWDLRYTALDENTHHSTRLHLAGKHNFKIVHAEISGLASLMFYLKPVKKFAAKRIKNSGQIDFKNL